VGALELRVRLLLDTHALLWWLDGDRRLPLKVRRAMAGDANTILVSAASAWEITTKARIGKLPGALDVAADVAGCVAGQGFGTLDITLLHAQRAGNLGGAHRDPFDRMLVAQAQLEDVALVSDDEVFDDYDVRRFW
jgi:PIN domain nuclease of toxin-antitoxin system